RFKLAAGVTVFAADIIDNEEIEFLVVLLIAFIVACGVAGFMTGSVMVGVVSAVAGVVAFFMILFGEIAIEETIKESLKTGTPSLLARLAFLLLLAAHLFLIWFSFLGGWRLFA
ncbi:membrane protein, partial [Candidatus Thiomargarita nelsonii]